MFSSKDVEIHLNCDEIWIDEIFVMKCCLTLKRNQFSTSKPDLAYLSANCSASYQWTRLINGVDPAYQRLINGFIYHLGESPMVHHQWIVRWITNGHHCPTTEFLHSTSFIDWNKTHINSAFYFIHFIHSTISTTKHVGIISIRELTNHWRFHRSHQL